MASMTLSETATDFIDDDRLEKLIAAPAPSAERVREIVAKSLDKQALNLEETAALLAADTPELTEEVLAAARELKRRVYGNRVVLFAPLYIGNECVNDCQYCAFRRSNPEAVRRTLDEAQLRGQVEALERVGHKRLILVFGEHPMYDAQYIADCVRTVYDVRVDHGEIRRVNINAAPTDHDGYRKIKEAGIGTYQIFQETYHHETYRRFHPPGTRKGEYLYRLDGLSRAFEAGCDDVGIGALFGLYDWRFEVLGLVAHARFLQERYGVGPHTISFPRLRPAAGTRFDERYFVRDADFLRLIAILRLSVPYTGLILTAREPAELRREAMAFGVSQIDAGSRIEIGGYREAGDAQVMRARPAEAAAGGNGREQFSLGDVRGLDEVMCELIRDGYLPSFCTACYRLGRTGEHFMEFAIPGFIKRYCTPNALTTLAEYLVDYAGDETRAAGEKLISEELAKLPEGDVKDRLRKGLAAIKTGVERDIRF
jgi:2-iminoacetate synthase